MKQLEKKERKRNIFSPKREWDLKAFGMSAASKKSEKKKAIPRKTIKRLRKKMMMGARVNPPLSREKKILEEEGGIAMQT